MVSDDSPLRIGVILYGPGDHTEELLAGFARALRAKGVEVGGLVQRSLSLPDAPCCMELVDIRTGEAFNITQPLGAGSDSCRLDPGALAEASGVLRREIARGVALLVVNKFSAAEIDGDGFAAETFEAVSRGIPVLTTLSLRYKDQWDAVTGGAGDMLPPDETAMWAWWNSLERSR